MAFGPQGQHINLDSFVTASPAIPPTSIGYLVPPPKQINAGDAKVGPRKTAAGRINNDSFCE